MKNIGYRGAVEVVIKLEVSLDPARVKHEVGCICEEIVDRYNQQGNIESLSVVGYTDKLTSLSSEILAELKGKDDATL